MHTQGFSGPDWLGLPASSFIGLLPHSVVELLWELQGSVCNTPGPDQTSTIHRGEGTSQQGLVWSWLAEFCSEQSR